MKNKRERMVDKIKNTYGLSSLKILSVMRKVPREKFVSKLYRDISYDDSPAPIGYGQTMSQPYTVAFMTHLLLSDKQGVISNKIKKWRVLEIGTGSGYQAAVLSKLVGDVNTIEIIKGLAERAKKRLKKLAYNNVVVRAGSGEFGWKEKSPFDAILVTAGIGGEVPKILFNQLKEGGVLVAPVGEGYDKVMTKYITIKKRGKEEIKKEKHGIFHFVPFVRKKN